MGLSCIRTSSTSHGIWFSSRKISFRMLGPHGMASPANGGSSNSKIAARSSHPRTSCPRTRCHSHYRRQELCRVPVAHGKAHGKGHTANSRRQRQLLPCVFCRAHGKEFAVCTSDPRQIFLKNIKKIRALPPRLTMPGPT